MRRLTLRVAVALFTFAIGVASASLYVVRHYRRVKETPHVSQASTPQGPSHPEGWQKVAVGNKFSFYLPPDMKEEKLAGNIEYIGPTKSFANKTLNINFGYVEKHDNERLWRGMVSCEGLLGGLADRSGYRSLEGTISGRVARQVFWQSDKPKLSFTSICFPDVGGGTILRFGAVSEDGRALDVAQQVFSSVKFP